MEYDVAVVGAGPAGSTTATVLARSGLRVRLLEKDEFPRHKLCGEFLSGDGAECLRGLGLDVVLLERGAVPLTRCRISSAAGGVFEAPLPGRPLSISRYVLDHALFQEASRAGAHVSTGDEVVDVAGSLARGFEVGLRRSPRVRARLVVCACGRSSNLERAMGRSLRNPDADPLVGFKAHYAGPFERGVVELHGFDGGYCGIQTVERARVNVCWITRASALREAGGRPEGMIESVLGQNRRLGSRLASLERKHDSYLAVSQLNLRPRAPFEGDLMMVGDAAGMIAPMCGDGMSMAISSGVLAGSLVEAFLDGRIDALGMKELYRRRWRRSYARRMWIGRMLHAGYERPPVGHAGVRICERFPSIGEWLIRVTRG